MWIVYNQFLLELLNLVYMISKVIGLDKWYERDALRGGQIGYFVYIKSEDGDNGRIHTGRQERTDGTTQTVP